MADNVTLVHDKLKATDGSGKPREISVSKRRANVLLREAKGWKRKSQPKSSSEQTSGGGQSS